MARSSHDKALGMQAAITRRDLFLSMTGFDPVLRAAFNDVDYCLRVRAAGGEVILAGDARATHHESVTIGPPQSPGLFARGGPAWRQARSDEADRFRQDWASVIDQDPCYPACYDPLEANFRTTI